MPEPSEQQPPTPIDATTAAGWRELARDITNPPQERSEEDRHGTAA